MSNRLKTFLLAIGAGMAIGMGSIVYLTMENKVIGALLFTVGLYTIVLNGLALFTGKVGYVVCQDCKTDYCSELCIIWTGNLVGTGICAALISFSRVSSLREVAIKVSEVKLSDNLLSIFILAIFCGILMYVAVEGFKQKGQPLILFLCVSTFILCGFEHCVANMFYFILAGEFTLKALLYLLVMTAGNSIGGMLIPLIKLERIKQS
ncbi:MAG: formate/nitrite transporter family protein [Tissierellia bacterium]|nr:formate/nitrite transporter family protein [Tissierellia bacterium]